VRLGYWHFVFLSPESQTAAEASECAADQDAFWEYHDLIFALGDQGMPMNADNLKLTASELGLNRESFDECLDSGKYTQLVQRQTELARQLGVQSTPAFLINAQAMLGAQPFENFQQMIEAQLTR
jgi:protein-disulfide isomerase